MSNEAHLGGGGGEVMTAKLKLRIYELRWHKGLGCWCLYMKVGRKMEPIEAYAFASTVTKNPIHCYDKNDSIDSASETCRLVWEFFGIPTRLMICTKSGKYVKGNGGERSFGADSKRRRG